jgi:protein-S-isoprenylcysteine O-methyltransferase Ste14
MSPVGGLVLVAYASLLLELVVFPIPSEASTYQLLFEAEDSRGESAGSALGAARRRSVGAKLLFYFLPTALGVVLFLIPLAAAFRPDLVDHLVPVEALRLEAVAWAGAALVVLGRLLTFSSVLQLRAQKRSQALSARGLFVGFFPYAINMHRRVLMEESHLARSLGPEYRVYLERVPRYLPLGALPR